MKEGREGEREGADGMKHCSADAYVIPECSLLHDGIREQTGPALQHLQFIGDYAAES